MFAKALLLFLAPISALAASHNVRVGQDNKLVFVPDQLKAAPGDQVHFHYYPGGHGVAEGDFASPCRPKKDGFWSGFMSPEKGVAKEMFTITINNTKPIFIYCPNSDDHCQVGMSMVINEGADTLGQYKLKSPLSVKSTVPKTIQGGKISKNRKSKTTG